MSHAIRFQASRRRLQQQHVQACRRWIMWSPTRRRRAGRRSAWRGGGPRSPVWCNRMHACLLCWWTCVGFVCGMSHRALPAAARGDSINLPKRFSLATCQTINDWLLNPMPMPAGVAEGGGLRLHVWTPGRGAACLLRLRRACSGLQNGKSKQGRIPGRSAHAAAAIRVAGYSGVAAPGGELPVHRSHVRLGEGGAHGTTCVTYRGVGFWWKNWGGPAAGSAAAATNPGAGSRPDCEFPGGGGWKKRGRLAIQDLGCWRHDGCECCLSRRAGSCTGGSQSDCGLPPGNCSGLHVHSSC